ncbi:MAG: hypothetical protein Q9182_000503 [Xanthomendoza sp. 2 TL-2023]
MTPINQIYELWLLMGILTGVGLMTIKALWSHYDDGASPVFIQQRQTWHVMILSVFSCIGRLSSGVGSDLIVKNLHGSRIWCIVVSAVIASVAQVCGANIGNPHLLGFVSSFNGRE